MAIGTGPGDREPSSGSLENSSQVLNVLVRRPTPPQDRPNRDRSAETGVAARRLDLCTSEGNGFVVEARSGVDARLRIVGECFEFGEGIAVVPQVASSIRPSIVASSGTVSASAPGSPSMRSREFNSRSAPASRSRLALDRSGMQSTSYVARVAP
jgi:hypothetical protein